MVEAGSAQIPQHDLGQELPSVATNVAIMFIKGSVSWQVLYVASRHTDGFKNNSNEVHILLHCRTCSFKTLMLICYSFTCILTVSAMRPRTQVGAYTSGKTSVYLLHKEQPFLSGREMTAFSYPCTPHEDKEAVVSNCKLHKGAAVHVIRMTFLP